MRYLGLTLAAVVVAAAAFFALRRGARSDSAGPPPVPEPAGTPEAPGPVDNVESAVRGQLDGLVRRVQTHPDDDAAHLELGRLQLRLGDVTGARKSFDRALQLQPASAAALYGIAACCKASGDLAGVLNAYLQIARIRPDEPGLDERIKTAEASLRGASTKP